MYRAKLGECAGRASAASVWFSVKATFGQLCDHHESDVDSLEQENPYVSTVHRLYQDTLSAGQRTTLLLTKSYRSACEKVSKQR